MRKRASTSPKQKAVITPSQRFTRLKLSFPDSELRLVIKGRRSIHFASYDPTHEVNCLVSNLSKMFKPAAGSNDPGRIPCEVVSDYLSEYMPLALKLYYDQLPYKLSEALYELKCEVIGQILHRIRDTGGSPINIHKDILVKLVSLSEQKKKRRLKIGRGGDRNAKHKWYDDTYIRFLLSHIELKPIWQHASRVYKRNRREQEWAKIVKAAVGGYDLPDDLVERLDASRPDRWTPGDLALEHAARLSGCSEYLYDPQQLIRIRKKAQASVATKLHENDIQMTSSEVM